MLVGQKFETNISCSKNNMCLNETGVIFRIRKIGKGSVVLVDKIMNGKSEGGLTKQEKAISLFQFIGELNQLKQKVILRVSDYPWWRSIASFPNDPENIKTYYRDRVEDDETENVTDVLLSVHKPEFQRCPEPDAVLEEWLESGWDNYRYEAKIKEFILRPFDQTEFSIPDVEDYTRRIDEENKAYKELFSDNEERVSTYTAWAEKRNAWAEHQEVLARTRDFFSELYKICIDLERDSETLELVVADGFMRDRTISELDHPILTRRVKIRHDAIENTIYIEDTDVETELYTVMFQDMEGINLASINHLRDDLHQNDYHPLDRNDLPVFFKMFVHQLSSESIYSEDGVIDNWQKKERMLLYRNPCYILRKRMDGTLKAIEQIIEHVSETGEVPAPIGDIIEGGKINIPEDTGIPSIEEQLAAVGGESVDVLLSKEANKEQLEIARRIERYNAVLVQGPPGTGKTHTIANLMGHFLAQGKSVLVTSQTQKALSVLKEKVAPGLQSLCVSVLDDSNVDMEKSIDGITSYMAHTTSFEVKREMESLGQERKEVIGQLAAARKKLFAIINQECNCIVYNGEEISPSAAATYVQENSESLPYIPGSVQLYEPLPLSFAELSELYHSNSTISVQDEAEFEHDIPDPAELINPEEFEQKCAALDFARTRLDSISENNHWKIQNLVTEHKIMVDASFGQLTLEYPSTQAMEQLKQYISTVSRIEPWMQHCAVDGRKGGTYKELWIRLIEQIQKTCAYAEDLVAKKFGKEVVILNADPEYHNAVQQLQDKYRQGGKIGKLARFLNKQLEVALNGATVNGQKPQNIEDCNLILCVLEMKSMREQCASYWNNLIAKYGVPAFYDLNRDDPEHVAANYIPLIQRYLEWFGNEYKVLIMRMEEVGLPCDTIFRHDPLDSEIASTEKMLLALEHELPELCDIFEVAKSISDIQTALQNNRNILQNGKRAYSDECRAILSATESYDTVAYRNGYRVLENTYAKTSLKRKREEYLSRLTPVAPQWAEAIRNRDGIHGDAIVPSNINDAWRWKQYYGIIEKIVEEPFSELQKQSLSLSKEYRKITAKFAEKSAWYHLLCRTEHDISMKQALQGWKLTVKKIGKGTGKNAPMYRAKARELMAKCQDAVPAWVMPIGKALESLNPRTNKFDIIIIDEASQSDISSLAILYMGKKLVIVGDDKQVSPMAVGVQIDKMNSLKEMYIEDKIPNAHLYDAKTSIYDIAATTFQPLMLHEHFRCVPEIIEFSNWLSYDFKIKPLRDCSNSVLLPAVVNYRVVNGERIGKTNPNEAKAIVALLKACIEQPEYAGKSFGIISLLGDEQVRKLQEEIFKQIDAKECSERRILCGNASNFQGDERDVIFLSVVDCANGQGPISKQGFGVDDALRKRYNVAASRAKDQLWVVDSLDPANDLKPGDIRKMLIDFSLNPESIHIQNAKIEEKAESPFESSVAKYLTARGYHLVQQWKVGAYRLDMVVVCGKKKIVIECDGERYHSGEDKIREDMERQTILERLGWRFIRIRGSEYYRNPEKTMERVITALTDAGIEPEDSGIHQDAAGRDTELLQRVKQRAYAILHEDSEVSEVETGIIAAALDPKNDIISEVLEAPNDMDSFTIQKMLQNEQSSNESKSFSTENHPMNVIVQKKREDTLSFSVYQAVDIDAYIQKYLPNDFKEMVKAILEVEAPLSEEFLLSRIVQCFDRKRVTSSVWNDYELKMRGCQKCGIIRKKGFLYLDSSTAIQFRVPGDISRPIECIAPEELAAGMLEILKCNGMMEKKDLYRALTRQCGVHRLGKGIEKILDKALYTLENSITREGEQLSLK